MVNQKENARHQGKNRYQKIRHNILPGNVFCQEILSVSLLEEPSANLALSKGTQLSVIGAVPTTHFENSHLDPKAIDQVEVWDLNTYLPVEGLGSPYYGPEPSPEEFKDGGKSEHWHWFYGPYLRGIMSQFKI